METPFKIIKNAAKSLRNAGLEVRKNVLKDLAEILLLNIDLIVAENTKDLVLMDKNDPKYDRLILNKKRIEEISQAVLSVSMLDFPAGKVLEKKVLDNGIHLEKVTVPMGVIGVIYESRPNVTIDVAALCIQSGNACILKGGKEAFHTNIFLVSLLQQVLTVNNVDQNCVFLLPTDRSYLLALLQASKYVDLIIPRGSQSLIDFVRENSKIPTIETGAGVCHVYVHEAANLSMATDIIINARASRPSVCNSLDCMIVDKTVLKELSKLLIDGLQKYNIGLYADPGSFDEFQKLGYKNLNAASDQTFKTEWLDFKLNVKTVNNIVEALEHISEYSSGHSEAIISEDATAVETFLYEVDAAAVYHNASTRFTDGAEFGLGAEVGISTQKLHARGPFALEKLVCEKWIGRGTGQVRW